MANEISYQVKIQASKSNLKVERDPGRLTADLSGDAYSANVQSIATSSTAVTIASAVSTAGFAFFRNLDATNYVEIGVEDGSMTFIAFAKLKPGQAGLIPLATTSIYAKADTAAVLLESIIIED